MDFERKDYLEKMIQKRGNHLIKILAGIRRCGKSYLLNRIFYRWLLNSGLEEENVIRFAFDLDEDIEKLDAFYPEIPTKIKVGKNKYVISSKKFRAYIQSLTKEGFSYVLLLDEVQLLENFVGTLNGYLYHDNYDVYVSGSNSKFLSSDIATEFRGRGDVIMIYPLSFNEYFKGVGGEKKKALNDYLHYGGLPLCTLSRDPAEKQHYLANLYRTIYLADLKERNGIEKIEEFDNLVAILSSSIGSPISFSKLSNTFHSMAHSDITQVTMRKYVSYLIDAFLVNEAQRYDVKGKRYIGSLMKYYFADLGIRNALLNFRQFEPTHLMENLIYNELIYRDFAVDVGIVEKNTTDEKGNGKRIQLEVDFVANKGDKRFYIQSAFSIPDEEKKEQEEKSLDGIKDNFEKIIITYDDFESYHRNQKGYVVMNLLEFLEHREFVN